MLLLIASGLVVFGLCLGPFSHLATCCLVFSPSLVFSLSCLCGFVRVVKPLLSLSLSLPFICPFCPFDQVSLFQPSSFEMSLIKAAKDNNVEEVTRLLHWINPWVNPCEADSAGKNALHHGPAHAPLNSNPLLTR